MWVEGYKGTEPVIDWNKELKKLSGELDEETAKRTLCQFLMHNIGFTTKIMTGVNLEPYQRLLIKGWWKKNFSMCIASRGGGKSTLVAVFAYLFCIFNPGYKVLMVSATFRSSRSIIDKIEEWANRPEGALLKQTFQGDIVHKNDEYTVKFRNGSMIKAVPLGDSNRLRGFRCNVLVIDEGLLISDQIIEMVLKPFLFASADVQKKQKIMQLEDKLVKKGLLEESEKTVFESTSRMIILSSASYQWENLYERYKNYLKEIYRSENFTEKPEASYLVQQFSWRIIPKSILDPSIEKEINSGQIPQSVIDREYDAIFTQNSDGYFSAKKMAECSVKDGLEPCVEIKGDPKEQYILAIDPNTSSSESADHFAMCVMKIVINPKNGKKIGMVVHQYACAGVELKYHIAYLYYILKNFNIVYIACDTSQGENMDFINVCNESSLFKDKKLELLPIEAEFGKDDIEEIKKQIKSGYNLTSKQIVQQQYFHSSFQKAANEYLKACFSFENIIFAGKAQPTRLFESMGTQQIGDIYNTHPEFDEGTIYNFIQRQDYLIELVKRECALIEPNVSKLGNISYDLPSTVKRNKNPNRSRKDSYSALFLCNWALKLYTEAMELPDEDNDTTFEPSLI